MDDVCFFELENMWPLVFKKHVFSKVHGGTTPLFFWWRGSKFCFEVDITPCRLTYITQLQPRKCKVKRHCFFKFRFFDLK